MKAAVRAGALKSLNAGRGSIGAAESHAKRIDPVAQSRRIREADPLAWSKADEALSYVEAFKVHKRAAGAGERANSALAMELKVIVSPEWLAETGDPRDANNPRVQQLYENTREWAESWGGSGSVWALRYDTDERGSGVVDVFMSPVREQKHKGGKTKAVISCRKAKQELLEVERALDGSITTSGAAMQSSWARWCQDKLDTRLERGTPKTETQAEHVHAEVYAKSAEAAKSVFEAHLFPDAGMELRPPTIEEEIVLKRAQKAIEKAAEAKARKLAEEITQQARKEAEAARKAQEDVQKIRRDMEAMREQIALQLEQAEAVKEEAVKAKLDAAEKAKKEYIRGQMHVDFALQSLVKGSPYIPIPKPESIHSAWIQQVSQSRHPWVPKCSEDEFTSIYYEALYPSVKPQNNRYGIEHWVRKYTWGSSYLTERGFDFEGRLKMLWRKIDGFVKPYLTRMNNIQDAISGKLQSPAQIEHHLKNYAQLSDPSYLLRSAIGYADDLYDCCNGSRTSLGGVGLSSLELEVLKMHFPAADFGLKSRFHAHLTIACFAHSTEGIEYNRRYTLDAIKNYAKVRQDSQQLRRNLGLSGSSNSGPSF